MTGKKAVLYTDAGERVKTEDDSFTLLLNADPYWNMGFHDWEVLWYDEKTGTFWIEKCANYSMQGDAGTNADTYRQVVKEDAQKFVDRYYERADEGEKSSIPLAGLLL